MDDLKSYWYEIIIFLIFIIIFGYVASYVEKELKYGPEPVVEEFAQ